MVYNSPFLPPYPYPDKELPSWADQAEAYYYEKLDTIEQRQRQHNHQIAKQSKGKVVSFNKRKA